MNQRTNTNLNSGGNLQIRVINLLLGGDISWIQVQFMHDDYLHSSELRCLKKAQVNLKVDVKLTSESILLLLPRVKRLFGIVFQFAMLQ